MYVTASGGCRGEQDSEVVRYTLFCYFFLYDDGASLSIYVTASGGCRGEQDNSTQPTKDACYDSEAVQGIPSFGCFFAE